MAVIRMMRFCERTFPGAFARPQLWMAWHEVAARDRDFAPHEGSEYRPRILKIGMLRIFDLLCASTVYVSRRNVFFL